MAGRSVRDVGKGGCTAGALWVSVDAFRWSRRAYSGVYSTVRGRAGKTQHRFKTAQCCLFGVRGGSVLFHESAGGTRGPGMEGGIKGRRKGGRGRCNVGRGCTTNSPGIRFVRSDNVTDATTRVINQCHHSPVDGRRGVCMQQRLAWVHFASRAI